MDESNILFIVIAVVVRLGFTIFRLIYKNSIIFHIFVCLAVACILGALSVYLAFTYGQFIHFIAASINIIALYFMVRYVRKIIIKPVRSLIMINKELSLGNLQKYHYPILLRRCGQ